MSCETDEYSLIEDKDIYFNNVVKLDKSDLHKKVIINIIGRFFLKTKDYSVFNSYIEALMDKAIKYSKKNYNTEMIIVHLNLTKMFIRQVDYKFIKTIVPIFQDKYPDRLEKCIITGIPIFFKIVYKIISPWIDKDTRKKIFFEKRNGITSFTNDFSELEI